MQQENNDKLNSQNSNTIKSQINQYFDRVFVVVMPNRRKYIEELIDNLDLDVEYIDPISVVS